MRRVDFKQIAKKGLYLTAVAFLFGVAVPANPSEAREYKDNNLTFNISREEASLTGCDVEGDTVTVPSEVNGTKVTAIDSGAFSNKEYKSIKLPATVTEIGSYAFSDCGNLVSVELPGGLTELGYGAFSNCVKLEKVLLGDKIKNIYGYTFSGCISLKTIKLPDELREIGEGAFSSCHKLTGVKLGDKVKEIGERAFFSNYKMTSIVIPASVKQVNSL